MGQDEGSPCLSLLPFVLSILLLFIHFFNNLHRQGRTEADTPSRPGCPVLLLGRLSYVLCPSYDLVRHDTPNVVVIDKRSLLWQDEQCAFTPACCTPPALIHRAFPDRFLPVKAHP